MISLIYNYNQKNLFPSMKINKADLYDFLYHYKDYKLEANRLQQLIKKHKGQAQTILDIGCGTASHHRFLRNDFAIDGLDIDDQYLEKARLNNPKGHYHQGNMINFQLSQKYDIILSLFSAIGYVKTLDNLKKAAYNWSLHMHIDSLVIIEPWIEPHKWNEGLVFSLHYEDENWKISRMSINQVEERVSILYFHYLIGRQKEGVHYFQEKHELGLFKIKEMIDIFAQSNIKLEYIQDSIFPRGLLIGKKTESN